MFMEDIMKSVLNLITFTAALICSSLVWAANYKIDGSHSDVGFSVKHLMLTNVKGRFNKVEGSFSYDAKSKVLSKVDVKIDAASVDTNDKKRDEHLSSPDFFDVKKNPSLEFKADKVTGVEPGKTVEVPGTLTIHGITKPVTLDVEFRGITQDPYGNERLVFGAKTKIKRADWGMTWNKTLDKGGVVVGDEVTIDIESESVKAK
jgi:polyisoprenoid-binding protein YceI